MSTILSRYISFGLMLVSILVLNGPAQDRGNRSRPIAHHHSQASEEQSNASQEESDGNGGREEEATPNARQPSDDGAQTSENSAASELQSRIDKRFRPASGGQEGTSLFNVVGNIIEMGVLIILLVSVPLCGSVGFCALIWHFNKMLRGGKKPSIG